MINKLKVTRKTRKSFSNLLLVLADLIMWGGLFFLIARVYPDRWWVVAGFLTNLFLALWMLFYISSKRMRLSLFLAFFCVALLLLQLFRQLNWLNLIFLAAFCLALFLGNHL